MTSWPGRALLLAGAALLVAIPALSQEAPESLLPEGFGDPEALPPPAPKAPGQSPAPSQPGAPVPVIAPPLPLPEIGEGEDVPPPEDLQPVNYFTIPEGRARPVDLVGPLEPGNYGLGRDAFGPNQGALLAQVMRRLDAPLPSRWTSILLRRALLSRVAAPAGVNPVDWVAERADLLLRMGEADGARMLVQSVDQEFYTPRMIEVAGQAALATADPAALCPLVGPARQLSRDMVWTLAEAMCASLESEPARAAALIDQARRGEGSRSIDLALAEKVVGAGAETRRSVAIVWDGVETLTPWRFGLASATGTAVPENLLAGAGPRVQAWFARAPMVPLDQRLQAASVAAALGVFSSHSLGEIHSLILDQTDVAETGGTIGARLRTAWVGGSPGDRVTALRTLWTEPTDLRERYARLILTAGAATRIPAASDYAGDAPNLVSAMLSAGFDADAARWAAVVQDGGDDRAWAMLALGSPRPAVDMSAGRVGTFIGNDESADKQRSQLLVGALVGLGRISDAEGQQLAQAAGLEVGGTDIWTDAIDRAARERRPGTVALLAGLAMQTPDWSGVPPRYFFRIIRALRAVGLDYEARMIAAEAMARA
ncbi:hypothetical protein RCO27_01490 [Sphingosinicella sp. LHD-64]|uniref:hypothetical protein n=1 Tax=Sphingosinicella sp. LHD-64 TaxID=3072139 RepID=UPI00280F6CD2|nr:hypothetical protein [Sphingosinicella sp. LHD-64]MDQ8754890.1 hypothetical protein [Sphingosinicella sp. LHD-64]